MGHQKTILLLMSIIMLIAILMKWGSVLMIILKLEALTALMLGLTLVMIGTNMMTIMVLFPFFVSEATILLTALLSTVRLIGTTYSSLASY